MYKKVIGLVLVGMMSLSVVGCGNDTVEYQEPQAQQDETYQEPQVQDEDLTLQYKEEASKREELEMAKVMMETILEEKALGFRYEVETDEKSNTVLILFHISKVDVAQSLANGDYYELTNTMVNASSEIRYILKNNGMDVNCSLAVGDIDADSIWFATMNDKVLYDCSENLN